MAVHVIKESRRCLQCKKPMCRTKGCPVETNVPEMIQLFLKGDLNEAGARLFENNPLSVFCSLVCDHEAQCEGHCIQGLKGAPIQISSIEHYISNTYLDNAVLAREPLNGQHVAVIGSGPAGLTVAVKLAHPDFRMPKSILDRYEKKLLELGIHIRLNTSIGRVITIDTLLQDGYDAVFIGSGVWQPRSLGVKGESLGNCHFAINYLMSPEAFHLGDTVAVIGSGNSAIDVARTAIRKGSRHVTIYARHQEVRASIREFEYAQADGVDFEFNKGVAEITKDGPMVMDLYYDDEGKRTGQGEPYLAKADSTVIAVSQGPKDRIVSSTTGLETTERGLMEVDENGQTTREGIYSAGDVVLGPWNVVQSVKAAKKTAAAMDKYLTELREAKK